jgi:DNA-binding beta-propeller fold protein YncE
VDQKTKAVTKFISKDNPGGNGGLLGAHGMAFGPDGHFYVACANTNQILRFDGSTGRFLDVFVATGSGGLDHPTQVLFGPDRNNDNISDVYVSSTNTNEVLVYSGKDGSPLGVFVAAGSGGLVGPRDMTFGPDGHLYIVSLGKNPKVYRFNGASGAFMDVVIAGGLREESVFITFDSQGDLYVGNDRDYEVLRHRKQAR